MMTAAIPAVILAAGAGRRMGTPKASLTFEGEPLLHRIARTALEAGCSPVLAVVGPAPPDLEGLTVVPVPNPDAAEGMASSIRAGVRALPPEAQAVLLLAVDQPAVAPPLLRDLLALAAAHPGRPAACTYAGTLGIPAVLPRRLFAEVLALRGDRGAKALLMREKALLLAFPGGAADLDTPEDLPAQPCRAAGPDHAGEIVMTGNAAGSVNLEGLRRAPRMSELIQHLTDKSFTEAVAQGVTVVDFWAPWCAPCRELAPVTEALAVELRGKAAFAKLNVDDFTPLSEQYDVLSMPTLVLFKDGQPKDRIVGALPQDQIRAWVLGHL